MLTDAFKPRDVWFAVILCLVVVYRVVELRRTTDPIRKRELKDGFLAVAYLSVGMVVIGLGVWALQSYVIHQLR